nr:outer membrane beta-barrel protein [uncultured Brevundimonas sp.]
MTLRTTAAALALFTAGFAAPAMAQTTPDWTGPYVGVFIGGNQANDQGDERLRFDRNLDGNYGETVSTAAGADAFSPGFCDGAANTALAADGCSDDKTGYEFGVRGGYDWQFGNFVVGAVGEYSAGAAEDTVTGFSTTPANYVFTRELEQLAAARVRLGYAAGPALIYATGGGAWAKVKNRFFSSNTANSFSETVDDQDADGYQWGGGVEYALAPNLSVTGEYLYTSLDAGDHMVRVTRGSAPATNPFVLAPNTAGTDMIRSNSKFGLHAVRLGMNYRF